MTRPSTVVYMGTSLDGFIAREDGGIDWLDSPDSGGAEAKGEGVAAKGEGGAAEGEGGEGAAADEDFGWAEFIATIDALVMGRRTFEKLLEFDFWPYEGTPLIVMSKTLDTVPEHVAGKAEISPLDPEALLAELGERGCKRVYVDGGKVVQSFLRADLIDELVLTRLPVLIGEGISLFGPLDADMHWEYVSTDVFEKFGYVKSHYRRKR